MFQGIIFLFWLFLWSNIYLTVGCLVLNCWWLVPSYFLWWISNFLAFHSEEILDVISIFITLQLFELYPSKLSVYLEECCVYFFECWGFFTWHSSQIFQFLNKTLDYLLMIWLVDLSNKTSPNQSARYLLILIWALDT